MIADLLIRLLTRSKVSPTSPDEGKKEQEGIKEKIKKALQLGWGEVVIIIAFICLFIWGYFDKKRLDDNAAYTKAIVIGKHTGVRGARYSDFEYEVRGSKIRSYTRLYISAGIGDTILIKFNRSSPHENIVIDQLPEGVQLE